LFKRLTFLNDSTESITIVGELGDRFAEIVAVAGPVINDQFQVVDSDGATNSGAQ
jgi:hypothetical protein